MRIPTFSRQSDTTTETTDRAPIGPRTEPAPAAVSAPRSKAADDEPTTVPIGRPTPPPTQTRPAPPPPPPARHALTDTDVDSRPVAPVVPAGPKPRASLLATLGLITGVAAALLVLSGPLLGYGIGVAGLALVLSLAGIHATGKRHVAGKSDALIGMVLALAAIVVGIFALTGSLSWLGTDMQPVNSLREWLDTQFVDRF